MIFISMSKEKEIIDIISLYDSILENKEMVEVSDIYDNVDFKDNVVGNSKPSQDTINTSLLQDVQTAARNAGVVVNVTTAVSGHGTDSPTRHTSGNAVDISMINNKAVSGSNRIDADKFVDALVRLGYSKNVESGNPKAVLTFGFPGHDNHVHVSNNSGQSSETTNSSESEKEMTQMVRFGIMVRLKTHICNKQYNHSRINYYQEIKVLKNKESLVIT